MAEGGGLLNRCRGLNLYPGFESLPTASLVVLAIDLSFGDPPRLQNVSKTLMANGDQQPNRAVERCCTQAHVPLRHAQFTMTGEPCNPPSAARRASPGANRMCDAGCVRRPATTSLDVSAQHAVLDHVPGQRLAVDLAHTLGLRRCR